MNTIAFVYITCPDKEEARKISMHLIERKLIACSNIFDIESMYIWKGEINDEAETVAICKTREDKFDNICKEVKKIHPYDVPCIFLIDSKSNKEYARWVDSQIE